MKDSKFLILLLVILFVVWVVYFNKSPSSKDGNTQVYNSSSNDSVYELTDNNEKYVEDAYELLGNVDVDKAFELGFGTGPGLFGSGRHTFEMNVLK